MLSNPDKCDKSISKFLQKLMKKVKRPHIFMAPSFMAKFYEGYSDQDPDVTACYCLNYYGEIEVPPI